MFEETSIQQFEKTFNRDNYITTIEGNSQLTEIGVTDKCLNNRSGVFSPLGYKVSMDTLIRDKKLQTVVFGETVFVSKKSFSKVKKLLEDEYKKMYPPINPQQLMKRNTKPLSFPKRKPKFVR